MIYSLNIIIQIICFVSFLFLLNRSLHNHRGGDNANNTNIPDIAGEVVIGQGETNKQTKRNLQAPENIKMRQDAHTDDDENTW